MFAQFALNHFSIMSTFASRYNNSTSAPLSESDNDDDNEQSSSFNQQNEVGLDKACFSPINLHWISINRA